MADLTRRSPLIAVAFLTMAAAAGLAMPGSMAEPDYAPARAEMVRMIELHAREAGLALRGSPISPTVLDVLRATPRHEFVPEGLRDASYADRALPIGYGQTISQPFIVALMTAVLDLGPTDVVLEVGTGSGYQAAVLAQLVRQVYTIELIPALAERAAARLARLGYGMSGGRLRRDSVSVPLSGSSAGWVQSVPLPDLTQGGLSPDRGEARQRRRKFMLPQPAADCHSKNTPASVRQDLNAAALYCRS